MPHCIIEYSHGLPVGGGELCQHLHGIMAASGLFDEAAIKTRAICFDDYVVAAEVEGFVHVTANILSGRSEQQRADLSLALFEKCLALLGKSYKISVDIRQADKKSYNKI